MQAQGAPTDQAGIGPGKSLLKHLAIAAATDLRGPARGRCKAAIQADRQH